MRISDWSSDVCSSDLTRQELAEVALADEADTGGILLPRGRQAGFGGHAAHVGLGQIAKREHGGRELCLSQLVQEAALVLALVARAQQAPNLDVPGETCEVSGGDAVGHPVARALEVLFELQPAVSPTVRVGAGHAAGMS